jgi:alanine dehydrogenase
MIVGVPKEIKPQEYRVGLVPASVREVLRAGGMVLVEKHAGIGIGFSDEEYIAAGAEVVDSADEVFARSELIVKVKEPQPIECQRLRTGQTLFTFLHLAADCNQARLLQQSGVTAIAYETVTEAGGSLPLLLPMSQVAGRMSIQAGAHCLEAPQGGSGVLLGGVPGVEPAHVVVIGAGVVGTNAALVAIGMGARVTILDKSLPRLRVLDDQFGTKITTIYATSQSVEHYVIDADLVIGAVLVPGAAAPKLITRDMIRAMRARSVLVDVAIDQGGCFETSKPTSHEHPTFIEEGIVHYCVTNMPGAVPKTSTIALNNATLPFVLSLVRLGVQPALMADSHLLAGLNVHQGMITHEAVAQSLECDYIKASTALRQFL